MKKEQFVSYMQVLLAGIDYHLNDMRYVTALGKRITLVEQIERIFELDMEVVYFGGGYTRLEVDPIDCVCRWIESSIHGPAALARVDNYLQDIEQLLKLRVAEVERQRKK